MYDINLTHRELAILARESDRRYSEVAQEREKALKIKDEADRNALLLAREIQTYKDEKANELREQINSERGHYATKDDLKAAIEKVDTKIDPILAYVLAQQGGNKSLANWWGYIVGAIGVAAIIWGVLQQ